MLASKPKQMTYHRFENVKLIQRKEDKNTVIQGEHCVIVLEEMESMIWDKCDGNHTIDDMVNMILQIEDYSQNSYEEISKVIIDFLTELQEQMLIEICEN
ncbi:MAG: PqqD family peptide modification chaperone [Bacteroidales bacterium]|nr:PqqD family peptide modification chaperone [Bacteroidales bacterium]